MTLLVIASERWHRPQKHTTASSQFTHRRDRKKIVVGTALACSMDACIAGREAGRQVSGGSGASGLTIYGHCVEQGESSPHTMHNFKNYVFYVIITLSFFNLYVQSEAPEMVY